MGKSVRQIPSFEQVMSDDPKPKKIPTPQEVLGEDRPLVKKKETSSGGVIVSSTDGQTVQGIRTYQPTEEFLQIQEQSQKNKPLPKTQVATSTGVKKSEVRQDVIEGLKQKQRDNEARYAQQALSMGNTLEEMAALFKAGQDPDFKKQYEQLAYSGEYQEQSIGDILDKKPRVPVLNDPSVIFGEATRGDIMMNAFSNPQFINEVKKNPQLYSQFKTQMDNFLTSYPEAGKAYLGNLISQKMEDMKINNGILNVVSKSELDKVVAKMKEDGEITPTEEFFINKHIRPRMGLENLGRSIVNKPSIRTTGLVENALESAVQGSRNLGAGIAEVTGIRPLIQGEQGALSSDIEREKRRVSVTPVGVMHELTTFGGQVGGQVFSTGLAGRGLQALKLVKGAAAANAIAGGMQAYGNYAPEARKLFPDSKAAQIAYSTAMAGIETGTENIFRDDKVLKGILGEMSPSLKKTIKDFTSKNISAEAARIAVGNSFKQAVSKIPKAAKLFAKAVGENTLEEVAAQLGQDVTSGLFEGKPIDELVNIENIVETARQAFLGSGFIAGMATRADMKKNQGISAKQIYLMARDPEYWSEQIRKSNSSPEDATDLQDKLGNLEYASNLLKELDGQKLTEKQKAKYLLTSLDNKIKGEQQTTSTDPVLKKREESQIQDDMFYNNKVKEDILSGKDDGTYEGDKSDKANPDEVKLFNEIYDQSPEGYKMTLDAAKDDVLAGLEYMKDKFAENPIKFYEDFDPDIYDKIKVQTPTEKLQEKLDYLIETNPDDPAVSVLDKIISDREQLVNAPINETEMPIQPEETKSEPEAITETNEPVTPTEEVRPDETITTEVKKENIAKSAGGSKTYSQGDATVTPGELGKGIKVNENVEKLKAQLKESRSVRPIEITEDGFIVDGEHRYKALMELGVTDIPVHVGKQLGISGRLETPYSGLNVPINIPESTTTGEGQPPISEPPKGKSAIYAERPPTQLSFKGLQDVANEFGFEDVKSRDRTSDLQELKNAEITANEWAEKGEYQKNIDRLLNRIENKELVPTAKQRLILQQYLATERAKLRDIPKNTPEWDEQLKKVKYIKDVGLIARQEAGAALRMPAGGSFPKEVEDFYIEEMQAAGVDKLTDNQKETVEKEFEEITNAEKAYQDKIAALEEENAKLRAEQAVKKARGQSKKGEKKDFKAERAKILDDIKAKLNKPKDKDQILMSGIPFADKVGGKIKKYIEISPDVAKLMKSYVEQGITELADLVKQMHGDLKEGIPEITETDVRDLIAGKYSEKRTQTELAAKLRDLRTEAKYINEYEALEKGEEPKSENKKVERNRKLADLKKKISEHDLSKMADYKKRVEGQIGKIEEQLKTGEFAKEEKKPLTLDKEALELQDKLIKLKQERERRILAAEQAKASRWEKIQKTAINALGVPRSLMSSVDFSAPLRQSFVATVSNPDLAVKAGSKMFQAAFSQKVYDRWFDDLSKSDRYQLMLDSKLGITNMRDPKLTAREEEYMSNLAQKIPFIGQLVKGSERAYSIYLNKMRVDVFNRLADQMQENGRTWENSEEQYKQLAKFVNNITGRGDLSETLEKASPLLNTLFFSPRLMASRVNTMTYLAQPRFYRTVPAEARKAYFRGLVSTAGLGLLILGLAKAAGAETEDDPRSPDFGKIKSGNTRWDIWGGHQQYIRLVSQLVTGQRKSSASGKITEIGDPKNPYSGTRGGLVMSFLRGKESPVAGIATDLIMGENVLGQKLGTEKKWEDYALEHLLPLNVTGIAEAVKDQGAKGLFTVGVPSTFGIGVQTYESKPKTFTVYEKNTKRDATPKEVEQYEKIKDQLFDKKMTEVKSKGVGVNKYGEITFDKDKIKKRKAYDDLTDEEKKDIEKRLESSAASEAKRKFQYKK